MQFWWEKSYISEFTIDFSNGNLLKFHHLKIMVVGVKHVVIYENDWNLNIFLTSSIKSGIIFYKSGLDRYDLVCPFHIIYKISKNSLAPEIIGKTKNLPQCVSFVPPSKVIRV